uniref:Uncharacterized protein n=1 Tax=Rousettus aegyptiacus TaxID=9407 RepID=A0A7J8C2N7_ROUAE|nr:hypothetical protein HJG63_009422 [Rousettus aegyptiacus]
MAGEPEPPSALCPLGTRPLRSRGEDGVPGALAAQPAAPLAGGVGRWGQFPHGLEATAPRARPECLLSPLLDASAGFTVDELFYQEFFHHLSVQTNRRERNRCPNNSRMLSSENFCIVLKHSL